MNTDLEVAKLRAELNALVQRVETALADKTTKAPTTQQATNEPKKD